jgi:Flp pilus assembly protein TadD
MSYGPLMKSPAIPVLLTALLAAPTMLAAKPKPAPKPAAEQPVTVESLLAQSHAAITKGDTDLALRLAQSAIVADPRRPGSYIALGDIYAETGQAEFARSYYDAALNINPAEPAALKAIAGLDDTRRPVLAKP